jgi:micrococcal nuclease
VVRNYTLPEATELAAGASVTLYTGIGQDSTAEFYWDRGSAVWNNEGDAVSVSDATDALVLRHSY